MVSEELACIRICAGAHPVLAGMSQGTFSGVKRPGREADYSALSSVEANVAWSYAFSSLYLMDVMLHRHTTVRYEAGKKFAEAGSTLADLWRSCWTDLCCSVGWTAAPCSGTSRNIFHVISD
jgi:hypothetical protein